MDQAAPTPNRRQSALRLLAAALAGAIGAFGVPVAAQARTASSAASPVGAASAAPSDTAHE